MKASLHPPSRFTCNRTLHAWNEGVILSDAPESRGGARKPSACAMRLKLYCNRYGHFKDALVCSVNCVYRTRCNDFALFYDDNRAEVDALVSDYYEARREQKGPGRYDAYSGAQDNFTHAPVAKPEQLRKLIRLEVLREMAESVYIWIDKENL